MLKYFQRYSFSGLYITVFLLILLWISNLVGVVKFDSIYSDSFSPVYKWINGWFINKFFLRRLTAFVLFSLEVVILLYSTFKSNVFDKNTFIAALVYIVASGFYAVQNFTPILVANLFIIIGFSTLIKVISEKKSLFEFFNVSVLFALSSMIYPPYIFLFLFLLFATVVIRSKFTKEFIIVLVGFLVSYLLYTEILFLNNYNFSGLNEIYNVFSNRVLKFPTSIYDKVFWGVFLIYFVVANFYILSYVNTKEIEKRTIFQLNFTFFVFLALVYLLVPTVRVEFLSSLMIPVSYLLGDYFVNLKTKRINKIFFWIFILNPIVYQLLSIYF